MKFIPARFKGVWLIEQEPHYDDRGYFSRTYCQSEFGSKKLNTIWPQCNLTLTKKRGILRGLHYQANPKPEIKLVRCSAGSIFDVVVDVRRDSPTYKQWEGFVLSESNLLSLYIPAGFAHGFQALEDDSQVFYQMSEFYAPTLARGIRWNDPDINVIWPIANPVTSTRDAQLPLISDMKE